jgi:predicted NBD/HSP70 family sugar kinase
MGSFLPSDLKEKNRATVYALLKARREVSRTELARESGISVPTVIKIVDCFAGLGLLSEAGEGSIALGRRPQLLRFEPEAAYAIGAEYDGVHLSAGVVDLSGALHSLVRFPAPADARSLLGSSIVPAVEQALAEARLPRDAVVGLGIGIPGTVDIAHRVLRFAPLVGIGEPFDCGPLLDGLEARLGFPIMLENDANAAALGEFAARGLGEADDLLFVVLGRGLGAGLVLDGRLRKGRRGFAGELGYLVFDPSWTASLAAPGWLEARTNLAGFWEEAAASGGPSAASMERISDLLAVGLADISVALDLDRVVLGRVDREAFGPALLSLVEAKLRRLAVLDVGCEASILAEPGVAGVAGLVLDSWLSKVFAG